MLVVPVAGTRRSSSTSMVCHSGRSAWFGCVVYGCPNPLIPWGKHSRRGRRGREGVGPRLSGGTVLCSSSDKSQNGVGQDNLNTCTRVCHQRSRVDPASNQILYDYNASSARCLRRSCLVPDFHAMLPWCYEQLAENDSGQRVPVKGGEERKEARESPLRIRNPGETSDKG